MSFVYVSNAGSGDIHVLRLDTTRGRLTPLQQVGVGGQVMPIAVSQDRRLLYAARRSAPLEVLAFAIDPASGKLTPIGHAALPESMAYLATDRLGRYLFSASYGGDQIAVSPLDANGRPKAVQQIVATPRHAHAVLTDPGNRFVFATSLGGDRVLQFRFDALTGTLTPNVPAAWMQRSGAGPRHLVCHPDAPRVYLLNELDASLDVLALDAEHGTLTSVNHVSILPPGFRGEPWAADLRLTPDARFLYASERRSSTIAGFAVDAVTGRLAPLGHWATQAQPRSIAIDPAGAILIAAGQVSHRLGLHRIDARSGALSLIDEVAVGQEPGWVEIVDVPRPAL